MRFTPDEIAWLRTVPALAPVPASFFDVVLPNFRFRGEVWAVDEGEIVFGHEPILRVTARAAEAQLVETALVAMITFETSVASKASRVVKAAAGRPVIEFGSRRAHGLESARLAARAACLAGCTATSNVEAARRYGLPVVGTMAHSWVMAFDDEIEAFRAYSGLFGAQAVLLIDTYDTIAAATAGEPGSCRPRRSTAETSRRSPIGAILDAGGCGTQIIVSGTWTNPGSRPRRAGRRWTVRRRDVNQHRARCAALGGVTSSETERHGRLLTGKEQGSTFPAANRVHWREGPGA